MYGRWECAEIDDVDNSDGGRQCVDGYDDDDDDDEDHDDDTTTTVML